MRWGDSPCWGNLPLYRRSVHNSHVDLLKREARRMHAGFVAATPPSPELLANYAAAREHLLPGGDSLVARLVEHAADLSAVELALRRRHPSNALTTSALLILSLAEARPEYFSLFVDEKPSRLGAWAGLAAAIPRYLYQWSKGSILLWWHERHA